MQIKYMVLSILNSMLTIFGQVLWKIGLLNGYNMKLLINPLVLSGILVYGGSTLLWFYIMSKIPFSIAYPLNSLAYAFSLFAGYYLFKETISFEKIFGTVFILFGVYIIARG